MSGTIEPIRSNNGPKEPLTKIHTLGSVRQRHEHTDEIILIPTPSRDPNDPLNWYVELLKIPRFISIELHSLTFTRSQRRKYYMATLICFAMFMCNFLAAGPSISILETALDFFPTAGPAGMSNAIAKTAYFFTTTALLQGTGNILWMPLVNKYGRRPIYLASFSLYLVAALWLSFTKSYGSFLAARIFMGFCAGAAETMAPLSIADGKFIHPLSAGFLAHCYSILPS